MSRLCIWINEFDSNLKHPERGYIPCAVTEGEAGYSPLVGKGEFAEPWYWGDLETAKRLADEYNAKLGLSPEDVRAIVESSVATSLREDSRRQQMRERIWEAGGRQGQRP